MLRNLIVIILLASIAALLLLIWSGEGSDTAKELELSLAQVLSGEDEGFKRALAVRDFKFPADHGPHPDFKTEWWYFTGNIESASKSAFGFQFTIFRSALSPVSKKRESLFATNNVYMAHLALTDVKNGKFYSFERFARNALGLAGAVDEPLRIWLEDWRIEEAGPSSFPGLPVMRLEAFEDRVGVDLKFESVKPIVLQGDNGLSRKGEDPGNASYYYSMTRLQTKGTIRIDSEQFEVTGSSWMDREWSTSVLEKGQVGWDWFALQMDNNTELMFYNMRRRDGSVDPFSQGKFIDQNGQSSVIVSKDIIMEVLDYWKNPKGERYPSRWRLSLPARKAVFEIEPLLADQEHRFAIRYWEGAVSVKGTIEDNPVSGKGYVELTGYAGAPISR